MPRLPHPPKFYRALREASARAEHGLYLVEGRKLVLEALHSLPLGLFHAILWDEREPFPFGEGLPFVYLVDERILAQVTTLETPPTAIAILRLDAARLEPAKQPALFLEGLQDPGNVGTLIRLAEWFGVGQVWLSPESIDPLNPKVIRASMGSCFRVKVHRVVEWPALLLAYGAVVVADRYGSSPEVIDWQRCEGLYLGHEGQGVSRAPSHWPRVHIPKAPSAQADSLNVATAGAILLYAWRFRSDRSRT